MARRKKQVPPQLRTRHTRSSEAKANESLNGTVEPAPEATVADEPNNEALPVVHHKKFGEIRVHPPPVSESHECPPVQNGSDSVEQKMDCVSVYKAENDIPLDGSVIIKPGSFNSDTISSSIPPNFLDSITDSTTVFMNVLKGIEMLNSLKSVETKTEPCENIESATKSVEVKLESVSLEDEDKSPSNGEEQVETASVKHTDGEGEESGNSAPNNIRRSTRIRHIGIMKLKEREVSSSPDAEKPVKVKSRWRRSSELEMHRGDSTSPSEIPIPEIVPETKDELRERLHREGKDVAEGLKTFTSIAENEYRTARNVCKDTKAMICDCSKDDLDRGQMGCRSDCLNRMLFLECGQRCALGESCSNKCFQRKRYADCKIFKTDKKGFGLRAEKALPGNTFIMEYVGEVVDQKEFGRRVKSYAKEDVKHFYFMSLRGDTVIDATKKGNISRFINHSCDPNAETQKWTVNGELRIGFFSKRPIQAGEEVTFDYRFQRYGKEAQKCFCESANCRGYIGENEDDDDEDDEEDEDEEEEEEEEEEEGEEEEVVSDVEEHVEEVAPESEANTSSDMELESPEVKPQKVPKPRVPRVRKPKVVKEKKPGRGRGRKKLEQPLVEDLGLEEEIQRLTITGLKNRAHTLMLSRLMLRAEDWGTRSRLLDLIKGGEEPCKRLFLDYRGLRFLHSWMQSTVTDHTDCQIRRLQILKTLESLPIPHKTMLIDSKVLSMVEEWSGIKTKTTVNLSPDNDSGESEERQKIDTDNQSKEKDDTTPIPSPSDSPTEEASKPDDNLPEVTNLVARLLESWAHLKEVFKIPKKERMEQMKEHEREADREYSQSVMSRENLDEIYSRYKLDKDRERERESRDTRDRDRERKRPRDSLTSSDPDWLRNHPSRKLSKQERRQMFALQVLREDEAARHRMQQEELWSQHKARCEALGLDPNQHPAMDPISGCPIFFDHNSRTWSPNPPYTKFHNPSYPPPHPHAIHPPHPYGTPVYNPMVPNGVSGSTLPYPMVSYVNGYPTPSPSVHLTPVYTSTQPMFPPAQNIITITPEPPPPQHQDPILPTPSATPEPTAIEPVSSAEAPVITQASVNAPLKLPPKWKMAHDPRGFAYYYHTQERKSQWEPPSWTEEEAKAEAERALAAEEEDESSSESSETESEDEADVEQEESAETMEMETDNSGIELEMTSIGEAADTTQPEEDSGGEEQEEEGMSTEADPVAPEPEESPIEQPSQSDCTVLQDEEQALPLNKSLSSHGTAVATVVPSPRLKGKPSKRRPGLVQERIISPRQESSRSDFRKYKEMKQKLKRRKEAKKEAEKLKAEKKKERSAAKKKKRDKRVTSAAAESSTDKKIKEYFKLSIAGAIVCHLNPYRKPDCPIGRITSNEDFKHLARKLTHFVMLKELKHCQSVDDLQCNESVKVKARDFVKKYMAKFGPEYERDGND